MPLHFPLPMKYWLILWLWPTLALAIDPFFPDNSEVPGIRCQHQQLNMDIDQQPLAAVLNDIIRCTGHNIMTTSKISGQISWHVQHIPALQALHWFVSQQGLSLRTLHGLWVIHADRNPSQHWHGITFHNVTIHAIKQNLINIQKTHRRTQWLSDDTHNTLWVHAHDDDWRALHPLLKQWDHAVAQIRIRAVILKVDHETMRTLGAMTQSQWQQPDAIASHGLAVTLPLAKLSWQQWLTTTIEAALKKGHGEMLSSPQVITLNHQAAVIETGTEIPYTEKTVYGDTSTAFKKAVLKLSVTPHLYSINHIRLDMALSQDQVSPLDHDAAPSIQTRAIHSMVDLRDGQTIMLGGIWQHSEQNSESATPGLSDIPILGELFKHQAHQKRRQQLVILITPQLVAELPSSPRKRGPSETT